MTTITMIKYWLLLLLEEKYQLFQLNCCGVFCIIEYDTVCFYACRLLGVFWKCARIGERKSPWVGACCIAMAFSILFLS